MPLPSVVGMLQGTKWSMAKWLHVGHYAMGNEVPQDIQIAPVDDGTPAGGLGKGTRPSDCREVERRGPGSASWRIQACHCLRALREVAQGGGQRGWCGFRIFDSCAAVWGGAAANKKGSALAHHCQTF